MRRSINVKLSNQAREGYETLCRTAGVSLSAFIEAQGLYLDAIDGDVDQMTDTGRALIERAREIDAERRRRPKR